MRDPIMWLCSLHAAPAWLSHLPATPSATPMCGAARRCPHPPDAQLPPRTPRYGHPASPPPQCVAVAPYRCSRPLGRRAPSHGPCMARHGPHHAAMRPLSVTHCQPCRAAITGPSRGCAHHIYALTSPRVIFFNLSLKFSDKFEPYIPPLFGDVSIPICHWNSWRTPKIFHRKFWWQILTGHN